MYGIFVSFMVRPAPLFLLSSWILKLFGSLFPKVLAPLALRLFLTPFRIPAGEKEKAQAKLASQKYLYFRNSKIAVYDWGGNGPKVLLVHGWSGRGTQMGSIALWLQAQGYHPFSFDAPGHGKSNGKTCSMLAFSETINFIQEEYGMVMAVGHSLGGASLILSQSMGQRFFQIATISAPASVADAMTQFGKRLGWSRALLANTMEYTENKFNTTLESVSAASLSQTIWCDGLVIHDEGDQEVTVRNAEIIHAGWKNSSLVHTQNLGHFKILHHEQTFQALAGFFPEVSSLRTV
jgi:pimeloyl-ACP methyl ester carboxylesterase